MKVRGAGEPVRHRWDLGRARAWCPQSTVIKAHPRWAESDPGGRTGKPLHKPRLQIAHTCHSAGAGPGARDGGPGMNTGTGTEQGQRPPRAVASLWIQTQSSFLYFCREGHTERLSRALLQKYGFVPSLFSSLLILLLQFLKQL